MITFQVKKTEVIYKKFIKTNVIDWFSSFLVDHNFHFVVVVSYYYSSFE